MATIPTSREPALAVRPATLSAVADTLTNAALRVDLVLEDLAAEPTSPRARALVALLAAVPGCLTGLRAELGRLAD